MKINISFRPASIILLAASILTSLLSPGVTRADNIGGGTYNIGWDQANCLGTTNGSAGQKFVGALPGDNFSATIVNQSGVTLNVEYISGGDSEWSFYDVAPGASQAVTLTNIQDGIIEILITKKNPGCTVSPPAGVMLRVINSSSLSCVIDPADSHWWRLTIAYDTFDSHQVVSLFQASTLIVTNLHPSDSQTQRISTGEPQFYLRFGNTTSARLIKQVTCPTPAASNTDSGGSPSGVTTPQVKPALATMSPAVQPVNKSSQDVPRTAAARKSNAPQLTDGITKTALGKIPVLYPTLGGLIATVILGILVKLGKIRVSRSFRKSFKRKLKKLTKAR